LASRQLTVTVTSIVTSIAINPVSNRVTVAGALQVSGGEGLAVPYFEDVTDQMSPDQIAAALLLVAGAQAWIDSKLPPP
jgi:hypothetical protein